MTSNSDVTACLGIFKALYLKKLKRYSKSVNGFRKQTLHENKWSPKNIFENFENVKNFKIKIINLKISKIVVFDFLEIGMYEICMHPYSKTIKIIMGFG